MSHILIPPITREQALYMVERMMRKNIPDHIIREALIARGVFTDEANTIIDDIHNRINVIDDDRVVSLRSVELGFYIVVAVMLFIFAMLFIASIAN